MFEIHPVKKVSVVIPVYNEQESLPELIRRTTTACESLGKEYEILLIDDAVAIIPRICWSKPHKRRTAILCLFCLTAITGNIQRLWRDSVTLLAT